MPRKLVFLIIALLNIQVSNGQQIDITYHKQLVSEKSTLHWSISREPEKKYPIELIPGRVVSPGTNGAPGLSATIYADNDTVTIYCDNFPFAKNVFFDVKTSKGWSRVKLRFNAVTAFFSQEYIASHKNTISFISPEVFELANIIWTLSPSGQKAKDLNKKTAYYQKVKKHFEPFLDHAIFQHLDFPETDLTRKYYEFRENSFLYHFDNNKLINDGPHHYVFGDDRVGFSNLFSELLDLVEDFASVSDYRSFYSQNLDFYRRQMNEMSRLVPLKDMKQWLESQFSTIRFQSVKVVFSELIGKSHSTQRYISLNSSTGNYFEECIVFSCGNRYRLDPELSQQQVQSLLSAVIFTELDHNYVNQITAKYRTEVKLGLANTDDWIIDESWYGSSESIFNEYLTHSLFCIWATEYFDSDVAEYIIDQREWLNVDKRGLTKFRQFNQFLISLKREKPNVTITELYPNILDWFSNYISRDN